MSRANVVRATHPVVYSGIEAGFDARRQGPVARTVTLFAYAGFGWLGLVGLVFLMSSAF